MALSNDLHSVEPPVYCDRSQFSAPFPLIFNIKKKKEICFSKSCDGLWSLPIYGYMFSKIALI